MLCKCEVSVARMIFGPWQDYGWKPSSIALRGCCTRTCVRVFDDWCHFRFARSSTMPSGCHFRQSMVQRGMCVESRKVSFSHLGLHVVSLSGCQECPRSSTVFCLWESCLLERDHSPCPWGNTCVSGLSVLWRQHSKNVILSWACVYQKFPTLTKHTLTWQQFSTSSFWLV